jgi:hypothetical protein
VSYGVCMGFIISCHFMSSHAISCSVMLGQVMPCHGMSHHVRSCNVMPHQAVSSHVIMSCHVFHLQSRLRCRLAASSPSSSSRSRGTSSHRQRRNTSFTSIKPSHGQRRTVTSRQTRGSNQARTAWGLQGVVRCP